MRKKNIHLNYFRVIEIKSELQNIIILVYQNYNIAYELIRCHNQYIRRKIVQEVVSIQKLIVFVDIKLCFKIS